FIEYGMLSDVKFYERMEKVYLLKNTDGEFFNFEDYKKKIEPLQKDKNKTLIYLYAKNTDEQYAYIKAAKDKGYDVLLMDGILDSHFINLLEQKFSGARFVRIDSDVINKIIEKDEKIPSKLSEDETKKIKELFEQNLDTKKFTAQTDSLEETAQPVTVTQNEFMRRMKEMSEIGGGGMMGLYGDMPESYNLVINTNHPLIWDILHSDNEEHQKEVISQLKDLALLSQGLLKGEALDEFIKRSTKIIK
ncbi:MAG: molecular chaperone HtpG, partial [Bacteroidales bacterium]|nr:molecular chaperone HtpG [Bacteroidales bacterium]